VRKVSDEEREAIARKLHPDTIRANLIRAGMFLAGWELLRSQIERQIRLFYGAEDLVKPSKEECEQRGKRWKDAYESERQRATKLYDDEVLALDKGDPEGKQFRASLLWLVENNALTEEQAAQVRRLRKNRNQIAHALPKMILEPDHVGVEMAMIHEIKALLNVLGVFWGRIDMDITGDFAGKEVSDDEIRSLPSIFMDYIVSTAEAAVPESPPK